MSQSVRAKFRIFKGPSPLDVRRFCLTPGKKKMLIQAVFDISRARISCTSEYK